MRPLLIVDEKFTGLDLSFQSYMQLTERHTTIRRSIANLAKIGLRNLIEDVFNNGYKDKADPVLYGVFLSKQKVMYEYLSEINPNEKTPAARCDIEGLLGNRHVSIPVELYFVRGNYPSGKFDLKNKKIEIYVKQERLSKINLPEFIFENLVHELTHYYQYLAKNINNKEMLILNNMPEMFSYAAYVLLQEEVEARIAEMYEKWRRNNTLKKISFFRTMLYLLSSSVFMAGNVYNLKKSPIQYVKQLSVNGNYYESFIAKYFLAVGITKTRYFRFVKNDKDYLSFIKAFNPDTIDHIKSLFDGVYQYCKTVFPMASNSQDDAYDMFSADSDYIKSFFNSYSSAIKIAKKLQNDVEKELGNVA